MPAALSAGPPFARPETVAEAVKLLAEGKWRVLAGGTDLYPGAGTRLSGAVLDVTAVAGMAGIRREAGLRVGAATTWAEIAAADLPPACRALQQAARVVGGRQVQVAGTIGGNLCNASPAADGVPPLLALGAEVELASSSGQRRMALQDFLLGPRSTMLRQDELMTAVVIPETGLVGRSAFLKLGARSHLVISIAMVAVRVELAAGRIIAAAIAAGSASPVARRLPLVEAAITGVRLEDAVAHVHDADVLAALAPIDDVRATAAYRATAAGELVRRAVAEALA